MSVPAVTAAIQIAGTVFAAYSVVKGIQDGNVLQAVMGGVGLYFGMPNLSNNLNTLASAGGSTGQAGNVVSNAAPTTQATTSATDMATGTQFAAGGDPSMTFANEAVGSSVSNIGTPLQDAGLEAAATQSPKLTNTLTNQDLFKMDSSLNGPSGLLTPPQPAVKQPIVTNEPKSLLDRILQSDIAKAAQENQMLLGYGVEALGARMQDLDAQERWEKEQEEKEKYRQYSYTPSTAPIKYNFGVPRHGLIG